MRIEFTTRIDIPEPAAELTDAERARLLRLMNEAIERIITDEIFGPYSVPTIATARCSLGVLDLKGSRRDTDSAGNHSESFSQGAKRRTANRSRIKAVR